MNVKSLFWNGKKKAVTFSFDDGTVQDVKLISLFKEYGIKGTFNLNSGIMNELGSWQNGEQEVKRLLKDEIQSCYEGFEVAVHGQKHIHLDEASDGELFNEIVLDRIELEKIVGYPVRGMVSAFGSYNAHVLEFFKKCGLVYNRGINQTYKFNVPTDFFEWNPTCHYADEKLLTLLEQFKNSEKGFELLYLWGHSYELDYLNNWDYLEGVLQMLSECHDIWFATNMEIYEYVVAINKLVFDEESQQVYNPSEIDVWLEVDGIIHCVKAYSIVSL